MYISGPLSKRASRREQLAAKIASLKQELSAAQEEYDSLNDSNITADGLSPPPNCPKSPQDVPPEILQHIFSMIPHRSLPYIRLVCRSWCDAVFSTFYRVVHIHVRDGIEELIDLLAQTPAAAECVRDLTISCSNANILDAIDVLQPLSGCLPNVSVLTLDGVLTSTKFPKHTPLVAWIMMNYPSTTHLCIRDAQVPSPFFVDELLCAFPLLRSLCTHDVVIISPDAFPTKPLSVWRWPGGPLRFTGTRMDTLAFEWTGLTPQETFMYDIGGRQLPQEIHALWFTRACSQITVLELHLRRQSHAYSTHDTQAIGNIIIYATTVCPSLRVVQLSLPPTPVTALSVILTHVVSELGDENLTLALHFRAGELPAWLDSQLRLADAAAPYGRWTLALSSRDSARWESKVRGMMPMLSAMDRIKFCHIPPSHKHLKK